jgi:hypothetical protein
VQGAKVQGAKVQGAKVQGAKVQGVGLYVGVLNEPDERT